MYSFFYFLVALAILIVIHEYGHFWVARRCGVKVLKFSVGFGKTLWRRVGKDGTEYVVAMIPLGGFVKMLDEREGPVDKSELDQSFNRKSLGARTAIVAAGPIANLLFAIVAYWFIFVSGVPGLKPIIGSIQADSPAYHAKLNVGDEITAVGSHSTPTWNSAVRQISILAQSNQDIRLSVLSGSAQDSKLLVLPDLDLSKPVMSQLGIAPVEIVIPAVVGKIVTGEAGDLAGLQPGDKLIAYNGNTLESWHDWVDIIRASAQQEMMLTVLRNGETIQLSMTPKQTADGSGFIGVSPDTSTVQIPEILQAELRYGPLDAIYHSVKQTAQFITLTVTSIKDMLFGKVSTESLGGPISIAQYAGSSAQQGLLSFVSFLAMISISLGILNLLPIPVLDGGHLMMYLIEWLRGEPLSDTLQQQAMKVGVILLVTLMALAFFNDLTRVFG